MEYLQRFKALLENLVPVHQGRIVQYFDDACLLSFDSTTARVNCAVSLQKEFIAAGLPIRIGMHLGEVIFGFAVFLSLLPEFKTPEGESRFQEVLKKIQAHKT